MTSTFLTNFTPSLENDHPPAHVFSAFKPHSFYLCNVHIHLLSVFSLLQSSFLYLYGQISAVAS